MLHWMLFFLVAIAHSQNVTVEGRKADVLALDDWVQAGFQHASMGESGLSARHDLLSVMSEDGEVSQIEWALVIHGWLRCAQDPHLRVRFDRLTDKRNAQMPVRSDVLLAEASPWAGFGPGLGVPEGARAAWLKRTWPWVSVLAAERRPRAEGAFLNQEPLSNAEHMSVEDHGAFVRWVIPSFGSGSARDFSRDFRRCRRQMRRSKKPVMLDLRGNLGGLRSRRHAVLGLLLAPSRWPEEREREWSDVQGDETAIGPMPLIRSSRMLGQPLAVMLDGLSFSASLLLADALKASGRAEIFGCAPLGEMGGCSGSPQSRQLPGSGIMVDVPTRRTRLVGVSSGPYSLSGHLMCDHEKEGWNEAVRWLLTSDLAPLR